MRHGTLCAGLVLASSAFAAPGFDARECSALAAGAGARCGVVYAPEDHAKPDGRKIPLNVIVLPATGAALDPKRAQYDLEGGPGFAATDFLEFYAGEGAPYRARRDIVLADMRGTGASNPLRCAGIEELEGRDPWAPMYPPELVAECASQLSVANDPKVYSTAAAARDIEVIRAALGYKLLDLNSVSYGTTLALRYIADFPGSVHAAAFMGTVPAIRTPPRDHAIAADRALALLETDCAADAACSIQFGSPRAKLALALARVPGDSPLARQVFMEKVRGTMYATVTTRMLPALLDRAAHGEFDAFMRPRTGGRSFADGLYLSITCNESMARMDVEAAIKASADTPFGAYRLLRQRDACAHWPAAPRDPDLMKERVSNVPAFFIAGMRDPVATPAWAVATAPRFTRHRLVQVEQGGHVLDGMSDLDTCLDATIIRFFDTGNPATLDVRCFGAMKPTPFSAP